MWGSSLCSFQFACPLKKEKKKLQPIINRSTLLQVAMNTWNTWRGDRRMRGMGNAREVCTGRSNWKVFCYGHKQVSEHSRLSLQIHQCWKFFTTNEAILFFITTLTQLNMLYGIFSNILMTFYLFCSVYAWNYCQYVLFLTFFLISGHMPLFVHLTWYYTASHILYSLYIKMNKKITCSDYLAVHVYWFF